MAGVLSRHERTRCYRLGWLFERTGWVFMAAVIAAAGAGLFGDGVWSSVEVTAGNGLAARYPRFARAHSPLVLDVDWTTREREATLWLARRYLDEFTVEEVRPPPAAVLLERERIYYTFRVRETSDRARVSFRLRSQHAGRVTGTLGVDEQAEIELRHLIFP